MKVQIINTVICGRFKWLTQLLAQAWNDHTLYELLWSFKEQNVLHRLIKEMVIFKLGEHCYLVLIVATIVALIQCGKWTIDTFRCDFIQKCTKVGCLSVGLIFPIIRKYSSLKGSKFLQTEIFSLKFWFFLSIIRVLPKTRHQSICNIFIIEKGGFAALFYPWEL